MPDTEHRRPCILQDRTDILEVNVDRGVSAGDQVCDAAYTRHKGRISHLEYFADIHALDIHILEAVIRDDDKGIHFLAELLDPVFSRRRAAPAFKTERFRYHTNSHGTLLACSPRYNRAGAGTGAAAFPGSHEYHICAFKDLLDLTLVVLRGLCTTLRICTGPKAPAGRIRQSDAHIRIAFVKILHISINSYKLNACNALVDHTVDSIPAATADAYNLNDCLTVHLFIWVKVGHAAPVVMQFSTLYTTLTQKTITYKCSQKIKTFRKKCVF